jgi:prophage antirepressor-like protein
MKRSGSPAESSEGGLKMGEIVPLQKVFNYEGSQVRTVIKSGEPWFVVKDVCEILELGNPSQAISRLDDDERDTLILNEGTSGNPIVAIVNEPGLYSLVLGSRKPEAKQFKRWITHEVLPTIRQTGTYSTKPMSTEDMIILQAQSVKELKAEVHDLREQQGYQMERLEDVKRGLVDVNEPIRHQFNKAVKDLALRKGKGWQQAYEWVYDLVSAQEHIDIRRRAQNRGVKPIDILEQSDLLVKAIRLAKAL